jgi:hypothetical protein
LERQYPEEQYPEDRHGREPIEDGKASIAVLSAAYLRDIGVRMCTLFFRLFEEIMMKHVSTLTLSLCMSLAVAAQAADQAQSRDPSQAAPQIQTQKQEYVYGSELMTPQERTEYQNRMRAAKTEQERETVRLEHHKQMQERARAQGKTLPDMAPADRGPGKGPGGGKGVGPGGMGGYGY